MVNVSKKPPFLQLKPKPWAATSLSFIAFGPIPPATRHMKGWLEEMQCLQFQQAPSPDPRRETGPCDKAQTAVP